MTLGEGFNTITLHGVSTSCSCTSATRVAGGGGKGGGGKARGKGKRGAATGSGRGCCGAVPVAPSLESRPPCVVCDLVVRARASVSRFGTEGVCAIRVTPVVLT